MEEEITTQRPRSREAAKRETRRALLEAGLQEIVERGLDAPSLDSICARAGFTRGAFYVHFQNREDFLTQVMDWAFSNFLDTIVEADSSNALLSDAIVRFLEAMEQGALIQDQFGVRFPQLLECVQRIPQVQERFKALLQRSIERLAKRALASQQRGLVRTDLDAEGLAILLLAAALGSQVIQDSGVPVPTRASQDLLIRLLAPAS